MHSGSLGACSEIKLTLWYVGFFARADELGDGEGVKTLVCAGNQSTLQRGRFLSSSQRHNI